MIESASDILTVTFDRALPADKTVLCVSRKVNDNINVLKIVSGEQANILYRLLTEPEQTEKSENMTAEEGLKPCPFCGGKVVQTAGITGIPVFICTNREDCGAYISFDSLIASHNPEHAHIYWNKRGGDFKGHGVLKVLERMYTDMSELVGLARQRVIDTPTNNPCYMQYVTQLNERTEFKKMVYDALTIIEAESEG